MRNTGVYIPYTLTQLDIFTIKKLVLGYGFVTSLSAFTTSDLAEGSNLYFTNERAQDAVGGILIDSSTIDFTYNDGSNTITAIVIDGSITTTKLGGDITTAGKALLDDADASAQRTTLGLGTLATQNGTFSGTSSGTNTGDQNLFSTIVVSGQSDIVADSITDTLTFAAGSNITLTTDATNDILTISASGSGGVSLANVFAISSLRI